MLFHQDGLEVSQARIAEGDQPKTACVMRYRSFEFLVMSFGLTNAPTTFCNLMNNVFSKYIDMFVVVYFDDIVVNSDSLESHVNGLRKSLLKLWEHKFYLKFEKCAFTQQEIDFFEHIFGRGKVKMDPKMVAVITN